MRFFIERLGCRVNQYEIDTIASALIKVGYQMVCDFPFDVYILNTCAVTLQAASKSRKKLHKIRKLSNDIFIVATGCLAEDQKENLLKEGVDLVVTNKAKSKLVEFILKRKRGIVDDIDSDMLEFDEVFLTKTRAYLMVEDGCENYCMYCKIPYLRGKVKSKPIEKIKQEIDKLTSFGAKEIVLCGINLGCWGKEFGKKLSFLISKILKLHTPRLRLSSIEPDTIDDSLIEILSSDRICEHFHIPLQSGDDNVLKRMQRNYTQKEFLKIIEKIRKQKKEDVAITTDVIVGFLNETEKEFENTRKFIQDIRFTKLHVFKFSNWKDLKGDIPWDIKEKRAKELIKLSDKLNFEYRKNFLGKLLEVVVEGDNHGISRNYIRLKLKEFPNLKENRIFIVKVQDVKEKETIGRVCYFF